jgi:murein DD-endopeptidase MepM/ murein hydrolase activator NlpD
LQEALIVGHSVAKMQYLHRISMLFCGLLVLAAIACSAVTSVNAQQSSDEIPPAGGGTLPAATDEISDEWRARTNESIQRNIERLKQEGKLPDVTASAVSFGWPVRKAQSAPGFNIDGISNFVDQNMTANAVLDYNCGMRTYDGHRGTDIFTWPFGWYAMDNNYAEATAAAPGVIVHKSDGNFDRSCAFNNNPVNSIFVQQGDGSVAWYLHFKKNSLTPKIVGDSVSQGEFLGVVGSSGSSTGPHLHFELYSNSLQLQDPFQGMCNSLNAISWWQTQPPYRLSRINRLMTHSAPPVFPECPTQEIPNEKTTFVPGSTVYTAAYYRDQVLGQTTQYELVRPNGTIFATWSQNSPDTYSSSYWYWVWILPRDAPAGAWKFRAVYQAQTYELSFNVGKQRRGQITSAE